MRKDLFGFSMCQKSGYFIRILFQNNALLFLTLTQPRKNLRQVGNRKAAEIENIYLRLPSF